MAWLAIDGAIGMTAGPTANSVALVGRGLDCAIEATEKKRLGTRPSSPATTIVGKQNMLCTYLSVAVLVGLGPTPFGLWWADPVVALTVAVVCLQAGIKAWREKDCGPSSQS